MTFTMHRVVVGAGALVGIVALAVGGVLVWANRHETADAQAGPTATAQGELTADAQGGPIPRRQELLVQVVDSPDDELAQVSTFVGFDILVPAKLPPGQAITGVRGITAAAGTIRHAEVFVRGAGGGFLLSESAEPLEADPAARELAPRANARVWMQSSDSGRVFHATRASGKPRSFDLQFSEASTLTDDEVLALVDSLLR